MLQNTKSNIKQTECLSVLENRLSYLDNEYSKQPTLRLKTKIGEIWRMIQEIKHD